MKTFKRQRVFSIAECIQQEAQKESPKQRRERQLKQHKSLMRELRKSVREMWARKIKADTCHFNYNDVKIDAYHT